MHINSSFMVERNAFYGNIDNVNFNKISNERLIELQEIAENMRLIQESQKHIDRLTNYFNTMACLRLGYKKTGYSWEEKYLILILTIDPDLDAFVISEALNQEYKIERAMRKEMGFYDKNLIKIEKKYVKAFSSKEEKINLEDRAYQKI